MLMAAIHKQEENKPLQKALVNRTKKGGMGSCCRILYVAGWGAAGVDAPAKPHIIRFIEVM